MKNFVESDYAQGEPQRFEGENGQLTIKDSHVTVIAATLGVQSEFYSAGKRKPEYDYWKLEFPNAAGELTLKSYIASGQTELEYRRINFGDIGMYRISAVEVNPIDGSVKFIKVLNGQSSSLTISRGAEATLLLPPSRSYSSPQ